MFREDGVHYYSNLSSPFAYDVDGVKYIDYDLDIKNIPIEVFLARWRWI